MIELKTGLTPFPIYFPDRDTTVEIAFNPTDPNLATRFGEMKARLEEKTKGLKAIEVNPDGTPKNLEFVDTMNDFNKIMCDEIDRAFGNVISDKLFQFCSPFAIVDGNYFILNFVEAITPVIREYANKGNKAAQARVNKHLAKYTR